MAGCTIGGKHFFTGCHQCILPFRLIESHHPSPQQSLFFLLTWCNIESELFIRFLLTGGTTQQHAFRGGRIQERPWENRLFPNLVADRKCTRLNSSHYCASLHPSSARTKTDSTTD